jgi:hypothetical protein
MVGLQVVGVGGWLRGLHGQEGGFGGTVVG